MTARLCDCVIKINVNATRGLNSRAYAEHRSHYTVHVVCYARHEWRRKPRSPIPQRRPLPQTRSARTALKNSHHYWLGLCNEDSWTVDSSATCQACLQQQLVRRRVNWPREKSIRRIINRGKLTFVKGVLCYCLSKPKLECGQMTNVMFALSNIGGAHCSTPQSLADARY